MQTSWYWASQSCPHSPHVHLKAKSNREHKIKTQYPWQKKKPNIQIKGKIKTKWGRKKKKSTREGGIACFGSFVQSAKQHSQNLVPSSDDITTMMQRWLTKLRCFAVQSRQALPPPSCRRLIHHHAPPQQPLHLASTNRISRPPFNFSSWPLQYASISRPSPFSPSVSPRYYSPLLC